MLDESVIKCLDTGTSYTLQEADELNATLTLPPPPPVHALPDSKRAGTVARLVDKALKRAKVAVAADTKDNAKDALEAYKQAVHFLGLALHVQREADVVNSDMLKRYHSAYSERIQRLEFNLHASTFASS